MISNDFCVIIRISYYCRSNSINRHCNVNTNTIQLQQTSTLQVRKQKQTMSGHNPHGRLGQPNPPWNNHLQVPSYIPRQPQVAHMSNERPMVRSPLTWHTPTHNEAALYNYMAAATHKTVLNRLFSISIILNCTPILAAGY